MAEASGEAGWRSEQKKGAESDGVVVARHFAKCKCCHVHDSPNRPKVRRFSPFSRRLSSRDDSSVDRNVFTGLTLLYRRYIRRTGMRPVSADSWASGGRPCVWFRLCACYSMREETGCSAFIQIETLLESMMLELLASFR